MPPLGVIRAFYAFRRTSVYHAHYAPSQGGLGDYHLNRVSGSAEDPHTSGTFLIEFRTLMGKACSMSMMKE